MMERNDILAQIGMFFEIKELVCPHTLEKWHEKSWQFLNTLYLHCLLVIRRDILQVPMICNHDGATQRGLRCNLCELVKCKKGVYLTPHGFGMAGDFTVLGMTAQQARQRIKDMQHLLPCPIRLEKDVYWLHFDVLPQYGITDKVYEFSA